MNSWGLWRRVTLHNTCLWPWWLRVHTTPALVSPPASPPLPLSAAGLQALGFVVLVSGTMVYGRGEELQEEELRRFAKLRARERWARVSCCN